MPTRVAQAVFRASAGFILDQIRVGRGPFDFTDALLLLAVTQANVEPILRDPELNRRFAAYERPPPDHLRRPISMNAISQSLAIPFETVRRRVTRLSRFGVYRTTPLGIVVPTLVVRLASHRAAMTANYLRVRGLHARLVELGAAPTMPPAAPWSDTPPIRAVARHSAEYLLRLVATAGAELGDPASAIAWLEVLHSSHEHLPEEAGICVEASRPVRIAAVAKRIGMPHETVRRRVADLAAAGVLTLTDHGALLAPDAMGRAGLPRLVLDNQRDLARLYVSLGQLGIVQAWDAQAERAA